MTGALKDAALLVALLRDPAQAGAVTAAQWTGVLAMARAEALAGTLAYRVAGQPVPEAVAASLADQRASADAGERSALWEAEMCRRALAPLGIATVLLKGTAYAAAGLRASQGRQIGDLDILVPRDRLEEAEQALLAAGWEWVKEDAYDDAYYRQWMHELPPMIHATRDRMIDVHHTVLPLTARVTPDAAAMLREVEGVAQSALLPSRLREGSGVGLVETQIHQPDKFSDLGDGPGVEVLGSRSAISAAPLTYPSTTHPPLTPPASGRGTAGRNPIPLPLAGGVRGGPVDNVAFPDRPSPDPSHKWEGRLGEWEGRPSTREGGLGEWEGRFFFLLSPADRICHAAAHLFADGDLQGGLRNLWDIHCLISELSAHPDAFPNLASRAAHHGLAPTVRRAARLSADLYGTEIPLDWQRLTAFDRLIRRRLLARNGWGQETHKGLRLGFYIRSHWLRMPPLMLARHLWTKWRRK